MKKLFVALLLLTAACASPYKRGLHEGRELKRASLAEVAASVPKGSVVIVSEEHGFDPHHENQIQFLEELTRQGAEKVSVGLEFIARDHQVSLDRYVRGEIDEAAFLKAAEWGKNDFADYRKQVLFPAAHDGTTLALNASRKLTGKIAKVGISGLDASEKAQLPPDFALGNDAYRERFNEQMKDHITGATVDRFFEAQSVWDDTMAFVASEYLKAHPEQRLVVIVGDFHAAYGGGLPDRLRARGVASVLTLSQVSLAETSASEARSLVEPHPRWGPRADYVWISY